MVLKSCTNHTDYGLGRLREDAATLAHGWRGWTGTRLSLSPVFYLTQTQTANGTKGGTWFCDIAFCLTQLNAQIACEVATTWNAALVQPAALQGDVEGVGHLVECVRLIIIAWVV